MRQNLTGMKENKGEQEIPDSEHHMEGFQWGGEREEQWGKGTGKKKHNWQTLNRQGEIKNGIGNRIIK